jgi:hypothetical protein
MATTLESLPLEILCDIAGAYLNGADISSLSQVSSTFRNISLQPSVWFKLSQRRWGKIVVKYRDALIAGPPEETRKKRKNKKKKSKKTMTKKTTKKMVSNSSNMDDCVEEDAIEEDAIEEDDDAIEEDDDDEKKSPLLGWREYYLKRISWFPDFHYSPRHFFQEDARTEPWKMLVSCIMFGRTSGGPRVVAVVEDFFRRFPYPLDAVMADSNLLGELLKPLGIYRNRTKRIQRFCDEFFCKDEWKEPKDLYGIGDFGNDAWKVLCRVATMTGGP